MAEKKLAEFTQEIPTGIWPAGEEDSTPFWTGGDNIHFSRKGASKMLGWSKAFTNTGTEIIHGMHQLKQDKDAVLYFGDKGKLYKWTKGVLTTEGTGYTGVDNATGTFWDSGTTTWDSGSTTWDGGIQLGISGWSFANFGSWVIATNGKDLPQIDKGAGFVALGGITGVFNKAHHVVKLGPYIIFFNTNTNDREGIWSDTDDPETWLPTSANAAGSLVIRELNSEIIAVVPLGNQIAVFGTTKMFLWRFIGAPLYFGYQQVFGSEIGAVSKKAVVPVARKIYTMGPSDFYVTDGVSSEAISTDEIREHVFGNFNSGQGEIVSSFHDGKNTTIRWYYPSSSSSVPDVGVGYNYKTGVWTKYDYGRTAGLPKEVFDFPFTADETGQVFFENNGDDDGTSALTARLTSKPLDFGDPEIVKALSTIRIGSKGSGLEYRLGVSDQPNGPFTYTEWASAPADMKRGDARVTGRYVIFDVRSTDVGDNWELDRVVFLGQVEGER